MSQPLEKLAIGNGLTYYKLAEFNDVVLAYNLAKIPSPEIHYVTWQRDGDNGFMRGHYFCGDNDALNERQAMRDFCTRSGLIRECDLLANDNLPDLVDVVKRCRDNAQSHKDEKVLNKLVEQANDVMSTPEGTIVDKQALISAQQQPPDVQFEQIME